MEQITVPHLSPGFDRIRGIIVHQSVMAVLVGNENRTRTIHWLRISDGAEQLRFPIPMFDGAPDPAVSSDLSLVAYAEETDRPGYPRIVIESPGEPGLGRREIIPLDPYGEGSGITIGCRCLAISGDRATLRASLENGELVSWDIRNALGGETPIAVTEFVMEEYPPVRLLLHGRPPLLNGGEAHLIACEGAMLYLRMENRDVPPLSFRAGFNYHATPLAAAFAPDGRSFAVALTDRLILWGTENLVRPPERAQISLESVRAMAFHPDNQRLITASEDGTVRLWNANLTGPVSVTQGEVGQPGGMSFSADGNVCILGGEGGRLVLRRVD